MSEQIQNNPDYLQHHPEAIEDKQKAQFMATAMHPYMQQALHDRSESDYALKNVIEKAQTEGIQPRTDRFHPSTKERLDMAVKQQDAAAELQQHADHVGDVAGQVYDRVKDTL